MVSCFYPFCSSLAFKCVYRGRCSALNVPGHDRNVGPDCDSLSFCMYTRKVVTYSACRYVATNSLRLRSQRCAATTPALMGLHRMLPVRRWRHWLQFCTSSHARHWSLSLGSSRTAMAHFAEFILFSPSPGCIGPGYLICGTPPPPPPPPPPCFVLLTYLDGTPPTRSPHSNDTAPALQVRYGAC
ncbi:hypothetical protein CGRA01v4_03160 [Colletotrichum graminicola]|nr:hypothetical protein CGRA01v4_03160 [Colletotrichum graminicola]